MMIKTILLQSPDTFVQRLDTQVWSTSINAFVSYPVNQRTETHTHTHTHTQGDHNTFSVGCVVIKLDTVIK